MSETKFITVKDAASRLKCTPHYIRKLLRENKIRGGNIEGSKYLHVDPASLDELKKTSDFTNDMNQLRQNLKITIKDAVQDVEEAFETDLIAHVSTIGAPLSGITHDDCIILDDLLNSLIPEYPGNHGKKFKKVTLYLHSGGGILEAAIKFIDIIEHYANKFEVIVPMMAKSAATLISLSSDKLYLTPVTELGPVDPIVQSPTNPKIRVPARSIDDLIKYYSEEKEKSSGREQTEVQKILLKKIEDLDAYILGSYRSALELSKSQIEERLSPKIKDVELLKKAVYEFTEKHPSHSFPITFHKLQEYGIGTLIENKERMRAVKTLLGVYQSFMAGNNIVKTSGNRDMNRNVVLKMANKSQVPTKTSL